MPSYRPFDNATKPWAARARRTQHWFWLGWYPTREEAVKAEIAFAQEWPPGKGGWPKGQSRSHYSHRRLVKNP